MTQEDKGREIVWGPEIRVDGVRPEWLGDDDLTTARSRTYHRHNGKWPDPALNWKRAADVEGWEHITHLRLPSDHPHYAAQQPRTAPSGGEVGAEVAERCFNAVRALAARDNGDGTVSLVKIREAVSDAMAIVAVLPAGVDGDLLEARKLASTFAPDRPEWSGILEGKHDSSPAVTHILAAIKRGRSLASGEGR